MLFAYHLSLLSHHHLNNEFRFSFFTLIYCSNPFPNFLASKCSLLATFHTDARATFLKYGSATFTVLLQNSNGLFPARSFKYSIQEQHNLSGSLTAISLDLLF